MNSNATSQTISTPDSRLLANFLHELNVARRSLTLYPPDHPQVTEVCGKTLEQLEKLFQDRKEIILGVAPRALFFEHQWLDKTNSAFTAFAAFLSGIGIASLSFGQGLTAEELIRFCQLLRSDQKTIADFGGFSRLLHQQQITRISVVPIDYSAFQSSTEKKVRTAATNTDLWEDFLHGLLENILDLGEDGLRLDPKTIAELLNEKLAGDNQRELPTDAVNDFVVQLLDNPQTMQRGDPGAQLGALLNHLSPRLQESFLAGTFRALNSNPDAAGQVLKSLSPELGLNSLDPRIQRQLANSPRLVELVGQLTTNPDSDKTLSTRVDSSGMSKEMARARLDVLFSEEQLDSYLPDNYSTTLKNIFSDASTNNLSEDVQKELKTSFENQSIELQCSAVIFELLENTPDLEDEEAIQQNLLDLSRFFLDTGNFNALAEIYTVWSAYIHSGKSNIDILDERVLANHSQQTFILEVLDGPEIWGEDQLEPILHYIASVGEAYTEPIIEKLATAKQFSQRRYWMDILEAIGADANQLLLQSLDDERWYLIRNLLIVLGKNIAPASLKAVNLLTGHPHPKVRQEAIRVLFYCNPATANRLLRKEFSSDDPDARISAIQIANLSHDPEVLLYLHKQIQSGIDSDFDLEYKKEILATLALIGNRDSLSLLRHLLQKKSLLPSKRQKQFQLEIIQSFEKYPRAEAENILREITKSNQKQHAKLAQERLQNLTGESP